MKCAGIPVTHDFRYVYQPELPAAQNRAKVSIHLNDRGTPWDPKLMLKTHEEQEQAREIYPNWDGYCKKDRSMFFTMHPRGLRCKQCGAFL